MPTFSKKSSPSSLQTYQSPWSPKDHSYIRQAFQLAYKVQGKTLPNPPVGAVLVKAGKVIGQGATLPAGQSHAEIVAIHQALKQSIQQSKPNPNPKNKPNPKSPSSNPLQGSTLYVTLEPCCHHGRTPPCTDAIIAAGIKEVVIAIKDPNPKVGGKGIAALRKAGIIVRLGIESELAEEFYRGFFFYIQHGRPLIYLKIAQSIDGRINAEPGKKTAITGKEFQTWTHELRTIVDAIAITGQTLRIDNPDLTPRLVKGHNPEVVVLSRKGALPPASKVFAKGRKSATVVLSEKFSQLPPWIDKNILAKSDLKGASREASKGAIKARPTGNQTIEALLQLFKTRGYHSVLIEGGPALWALFLNSGVWDSLFIATAPIVLPQGERWDRLMAKDWGKSLKFRNFATFGKDFLAEFGNSEFRG